MAKNKKPSKKQAPRLSPEKYIASTAPTLPIGECYVSSSDDTRIVIVTRRRPSGNLVMGQYLVDMYCLGVKNTFFHHNLPAEDFAEMLEEIPFEMTPIPYEEAHNIIYGAIAWAEDAGIPPHKDFSLTRHILKEDTEDVPLMEMEFGDNGRYHLVISPDGKERRFIGTLRKNVPELLDISFASDEDEEYEYEDEGYEDEESTAYNISDSYYEPYTYSRQLAHIDPPIKYPIIEEALAPAPDLQGIRPEVADKIHEIDDPDIVADICTMIHRVLDRYPENGYLEPKDSNSLIKALTLLSFIESAASYPTLCEVASLPKEMLYSEDDVLQMLLGMALTHRAYDHLADIEKLISTPGISDAGRLILCSVVTSILHHNQGKHAAQAQGILSRLIERISVDLPERHACSLWFVLNLLPSLIHYRLDKQVEQLIEAVEQSGTNPHMRKFADALKKESEGHIAEEEPDTEIPTTYEELYNFIN